MDSRQQAAKALLERRLRRKNLEEWCRFVLEPRKESPALHHLKIIETLQAVADGHVKRVMLLMPPGAAKSTYTSVLFPPWYLQRYPANLILACSYSYQLIEGFGRRCRDLIDEYENVLGISLSNTACASGDWRINQGGGYFCAGVGAGIAGHRADLGFIDDYLGTEVEADSQVTRNRIYEWYRKDFVPRLKPQAARIIIANRRHEDDLVGRLLETEASKWLVLRFPMEAEENDILGRKPGERLWPEWFTQDQVTEAKLESRTWAGLYQQRPAPEEGNFFKRDWLVGYDVKDLPKNMRYYVGADYAFRKNSENDKTCFLGAGMDETGRLWILPDWFWERCDTLEAVEAMLDMCHRLKPIVWWAGKENITGSIAPFLHKRMQERGIYAYVEELSESEKKEQKAHNIRGRMAARMVMFPKFVPGWERAEHELLTFPGSKHDDFVDALSKLGQGLGSMVAANPPRREWDGVVEPVRLTCQWAERSHRMRERRLNTFRN